MRFFGATLLLAALVCVPSTSNACEPIVPLMMLYAGAGGWGAVATKSALGLLVVVAIKCAVFLWKSEYKSVAALVLANVVSTVVGIAAVAMMGAAVLFFVTIPVLFLAFLIPAKSIQKVNLFGGWHIGWISASLVAVMVGSVILWLAAMKYQDSSHSAYWLLKLSYSAVGMALSFVVTIACEEVVISALYTRRTGRVHTFFEPVSWCNAAAFIVALGGAAVVAIPKRLASPDFLISFLRMVSLA